MLNRESILRTFAEYKNIQSYIASKFTNDRDCEYIRLSYRTIKITSIKDDTIINYEVINPQLGLKAETHRHINEVYYENGFFIVDNKVEYLIYTDIVEDDNLIKLLMIKNL